MNSPEAKQILVLYRPGIDANNAEFAEALDQIGRDGELRRWFEQHCAFQTAMREKFGQIPVPSGLRAAILAQNQMIRPAFWRRPPVWLAAAAVVMLALGLAFWWPQGEAHDRFTDYRKRMVREALRQYRLDIKTNNLAAVRQFLGTNGAPVDFVLPIELDRLALIGGGLKRWHGHKVSMVCFDRGDQRMLFLFVVDRNSVQDAPSETPALAKVSTLTTVSWAKANRAYLLAGPDDSEAFRKLP